MFPVACSAIGVKWFDTEKVCTRLYINTFVKFWFNSSIDSCPANFILNRHLIRNKMCYDQGSKKNIFSLKIFIRWFVFVEKKMLISLNSLIWKTKSTNKYWFENSSTNSTNQRIKFSLICKNFDEFSTKIPINQSNFQRINHNFQSIGQFRTKFQRIRRFFRWSVEIFVDSLKFSLIRWNFRWKFVEVL